MVAHKLCLPLWGRWPRSGRKRKTCGDSFPSTPLQSPSATASPEGKPLGGRTPSVACGDSSLEEGALGGGPQAKPSPSGEVAAAKTV